MTTNNQTTDGATKAKLSAAVTISQEDAIVFAKLMPPESTTSRFDRVAGMIAYAQYALHKHQFIEQYTKEEGKAPTEDHLKSIILTFKDAHGTALESLKEQSRNLLKQYAEEYAASVDQTRLLQPIKNEVRSRTRFWPNVAASVTAALIYSFVVAVIIFIATAAMPDTKFSRIIRILTEPDHELVNGQGHPTGPTNVSQPSPSDNPH
jgi:hypothetical protein